MTAFIDDDDRIAILHHKNSWHILCMDRCVWVLDRKEWNAAWAHAGYGDDNDFSDRVGIAILDETTVDRFLQESRSFHLDTEWLRREVRELLLLTDDWWDVEYIMPRLLIDFDLRRLTAWYSYDDGPSWETLVPHGWTGLYADFTVDETAIPQDYRYWIVDGQHFADRFGAD